MIRILLFLLIPLTVVGLTACPDDPTDDDSAGDDDSSPNPTPNPTPSPTPTPVDCPSTDLTSYVNGSNYAGSTTGETDDVSASCSSQSAGDLWVHFYAPSDGTYVVSTANPDTNYDTLLSAVADCTDPVGTEIACNDDAVGLQSILVLNLVAGQLVFINVDGYSGEGNFELSIRQPICGDGVLDTGEECDDGNLVGGDGCESNCMISVICGDGITTGTEECDDGGTVNGDGCSDTCLWECVADAWEDNDDESQAVDIGGMTWPLDIAGTLCPTDESVQYAGWYLDFFAIDLVAGEILDMALADGATTTCPNMEVIFQLYDTNFNILAEDFSDGLDCPTWSIMAPATNLYWVVVWNNAMPWPEDYRLTGTRSIPVCGDGITEGLEECDDGNLVDGDGCQADCTLPRICGDGILAPTEECDDGNLIDGDGCQSNCLFPRICGDGQVAAPEECDDGNNVDGDGCSSICTTEDASCTIVGDLTTDINGPPILGATAGGPDERSGRCVDEGAPEATYTVTPTNSGLLRISLDHPGTDYDTGLYVRTACANALTEIACNDDTAGLTSEVIFEAQAGVTYYVVVAGFATESGNFEMSLEMGQTCGDGTLDALEECDDGNTNNGDGCSSGCTVECSDDVWENNDSVWMPTDIRGMGFPYFVDGALCPSEPPTAPYGCRGDVFLTDATAGSFLSATIGPGATTDCLTQDLFVGIHDVYGTPLSEDGSDAVDCPVAGATVPASGLYYAWVIDCSFQPIAQTYQLTIDQIIPVCGNGVREGIEECDDGNTVDGDGCQGDCTLPPLCQRAASLDLGTVNPGTFPAAIVDLPLTGDTYPDLGCSAPGGNDASIALAIPSGTTLTIDYDHSGGDVQYALFDDNGCIEIACIDPFPNEIGQLSFPVQAGNYHLVIQAFGPGAEALVNLVFDVQ